MTTGRTSLSLTFHPAMPSRWSDLAELFGERGESAVWCMFWRLPRKEFDAGKGPKNKRALKRLVESGRKPGILAYDGKEPIGWCAIAPRADYTALKRSRILKPVDDHPVWSVSCLFIQSLTAGKASQRCCCERWLPLRRVMVRE